MLELCSVSTRRGEHLVLRNVNLRLAPGESVCVCGITGSGKSTLLSLLLGEVTPLEGAIRVDEVDLRLLPPPILQIYRSRLGVIFQETQLLPRETVAENLSIILDILHFSEKEKTKRLQTSLKAIGLTNRASAFPHELSAGERRLVSIARAVIHDPLIILADEPLKGLDPTQEEFALTLLKKAQKQGASLLCLTQNSSLSKYLGTQLLHLENGSLEQRSASQKQIEQREQRAKKSFEAKIHQLHEKLRMSPERARQWRKIKITPLRSTS